MKNLVLGAVIIVIVFVSRVPFSAETPFEWDAVNFLYSVEHFDISDDQPHPPGYIGYVYLGKAINMIVGEPRCSLLTLNLLATILLLMGIHTLVRPLWDFKNVCYLSVIIVFNPLVWFYGEVTLSYLSGAAAWVWCVWLLLRVREGKDRYPFITGIIWGLAGAIRPDVVVFLIPAGLYAVQFTLFSSKSRYLFLGFIAGILGWLIPTVLMTGGSFSESLRAIFTSSTGNYSVLMGASPLKHLEMLSKAALWFFIGCGWMLPMFFRKDFFYYIRNNSLMCMLTFAILPSMAFQLLFFLIKPGFILLYLPGIIIIGLGYLSLQRHFQTKAIIIVILSSAYFLFYPAQADPPGVNDINSNYIQTAAGKLNTVAKSNIESNDHYTKIWTERINSDYDAESTLIVTCGRDYNWRKAVYFLPDFRIVEFNLETATPMQIRMDGKTSDHPSKELNLSNIKTLLILTEDQGFAEKISPKNARLQTIVTDSDVRWFECEITGTVQTGF